MTLLGRIGRFLTTTMATRVLVATLVAAVTLVTGATAGWIAVSSSHQLPDLRVNGVPCEITVLTG